MSGLRRIGAVLPLVPRGVGQCPNYSYPFSPMGSPTSRTIWPFRRRDGQVTYFNGHMPVFTHAETDSADWPSDEFIATEVRMASGQQITIMLAERGTKLSNGLWLREFRKLSDSGHQTAFLSTDYRAPAAVLAPAMFGRWSQENFFRYMRQSFNVDGLVDYRSDKVPDTIMVVIPACASLI